MKHFFMRTLLAGLYLIAPAMAVAATEEVDNTSINSRDASASTLTASDQMKGTESDVELTRRIRAELSRDQSLSTYAKNIKIITLASKVTLRGPVRSVNEKTKIENIATTLAGAKMVRNQLEVQPAH